MVLEKEKKEKQAIDEQSTKRLEIIDFRANLANTYLLKITRGKKQNLIFLTYFCLC